MKELRKKVMLLLGERLLEFGFKKKVLNTFVRQLDDNRIQNIGCLLYTSDAADD